MISKVFGFSGVLKSKQRCGCICQCDMNSNDYLHGYNDGTGFGAHEKI